MQSIFCRSVSLGILLAVILMKGAGCMVEEDKTGAMLSAMENKYKMSFVFESYCEGQAGSPYTIILVSCEEFPGAEIIVRIYRNENGEEILQDNLLSCLLKEEIQKKVAERVRKVYGDCKVYYKPAFMVLPADYEPYMSAEEFLSRRESMVHIYIYLPPWTEAEQKERMAGLLERELIQNQYKIKGLICYTNNNECYRNVSEDSFRGIYTEKESIRTTGMFLLENTRGFSYLRWS